MKKITTADCKKFLVSLVKANPDFLTKLWGNPQDPTGQYAVSLALTESNWKRAWKASARAESVYSCDNGYSRHDGTVMSFSDIASVRCFILSPEDFDSAAQFIVIEGTDGNLYLGENVGD